MNYSTTDTYKMKREIMNYAKKFSGRLSAAEAKFNADMLYGMVASQSCLLTQISQRLHAMRKFMGINFFEQDVPNATTLLKFRHLLEEHGLGKQFFDAINRCLEQAGRMMHDGSIVDATLISAPSSTKMRKRSGTRKCTP